jgi:hypothetical protein
MATWPFDRQTRWLVASPMFHTSAQPQPDGRLLAEPLPKSAAGKILKRQLREPHWVGQHTYVSGS